MLQLTGDALHLVGEACSVARTLQPAMVVIEDVDLIAEDRGMHPGQHPLLFQLLNEMDGLAEDADVVFVLTTNRADLLEPALAARPGRVDQAVELDAAGRRRPPAAARAVPRRRSRSTTAAWTTSLARTDGVTASFLKELLRRAAAARRPSRRRRPDGPLRVSAGRPRRGAGRAARHPQRDDQVCWARAGARPARAGAGGVPASRPGAGVRVILGVFAVDHGVVARDTRRRAVAARDDPMIEGGRVGGERRRRPGCGQRTRWGSA